jgi:hypothetical protein
MKTKVFSVISALIFAALAVSHVLKLALGWDVQLNGKALPEMASYIAIALFGLLACVGFACCCCKCEKK